MSHANPHMSPAHLASFFRPYHGWYYDILDVNRMRLWAEASCGICNAWGRTHTVVLTHNARLNPPPHLTLSEVFPPAKIQQVFAGSPFYCESCAMKWRLGALDDSHPFGDSYVPPDL